MGNTGKKILILGVVLAIVVAGVLAFYPTIVAPPTDVPVNNLHKMSLVSNINSFSVDSSIAYNNNVYAIVVDKLSMYLKEAFMTEPEIDDQMKTFVKQYVPIFISQSNAKFNASKWVESDHKQMRKRIDNLKSLEISKDSAGRRSSPLTATHMVELRKIESILKDYEQAKKYASYSTFKSLEDANEKIKKAAEYSKKVPLKNCEELREKLSRVKVNIGNSHYWHVSGMVEEMANYKNMTKESFASLASKVNEAIKKYEGNSSQYGSNAKSATDLRTRAAGYDKASREWFVPEQITINTNYEWSSMASPNSSYRAFQSSSNWHKPSSTATMSFTIKGYEKFTFYVRSNGEPNHDYLMVGLDSKPTESYNRFNTKGKSNGGSSFDSYNSVTFNDLNKSRSYTIYVVYRKDKTENIANDRGYVLIPYAKQ